MKITVLDRLILKGFVGPCLLAFFIVEFVLVMQYMWKKIDELLGKGYSTLDYLELLGYMGMTLVPLALPLTILLASVMVYGDMAEKYELSSIKSSGTSLLRILWPGLVIAFLIAGLSIFSSNYLKPMAFDRYSKKYKAMKTNKLTFAFDENIFNYDFTNYSIRIGKKEKDGRSISDILIYDMSDTDNSVTNFIQAKSGEMYTTPDKRYLIMDLYDGYQFKEERAGLVDKVRRNFNLQGRPVARYEFSSLRKTFDLSEVINLTLTRSSYQKNKMMNSAELLNSIDSFYTAELENREKNIYPYTILGKQKKIPEEIIKDNKQRELLKKATAQKKIKVKRTSTPARVITEKVPEDLKIDFSKIDNQKVTSLFDLFELDKKDKFIEQAKKQAQATLSAAGTNRYENIRIKRDVENYKYTLHVMYSWALICIIFLFIGGPAGAIVRKGGFGYPLLIAIGFYLTFVMSGIFGEKLVRTGSLNAITGAWLPCFILAPFAIYFTYRAMMDNRPIINWKKRKINLPNFTKRLPLLPQE